MLIYTEYNTPRLQYVLNFIFRDVFSTDFRIVSDGREFRDYRGAKINYSTAEMGDSFHIPVSGLLSAEGIEDIDPRPVTSGSLPVLFPAASPDLGYDLFASVFYMISRYEEYLSFKGDRYGRFEAANSLAGKNEFLEKPVVDLWLQDLREKLQKRFQDIRLQAGTFQFLPTCDIDLPFAYLHRGRIRTIGARLRSGIQGSDDSKLRKEVLNGKTKDPFDTFSEIEAIHSLHRIRPKIFFLTSGYGKYDKSISPRNMVFRDLVKQTMNYADVGIHPSFRASDNAVKLQKEIQMLSGLSGKKITDSRQHYLRFRLPQAYRNYLDAGIRVEYSMGFASAAGFRAGTARPFHFYDLLREEETALRVIPFQVMDRTLKDYMKLTPETALDKILSLADATRASGGIFSTIWHNDAFSNFGEWKGWKDVYLQMIDSLAN